jgi:hypothetical protein
VGQDRILLVTACWRMNLTLRQLAQLFSWTMSAAVGVVCHRRSGPLHPHEEHSLAGRRDALRTVLEDGDA